MSDYEDTAKPIAFTKHNHQAPYSESSEDDSIDGASIAQAHQKTHAKGLKPAILPQALKRSKQSAMPAESQDDVDNSLQELFEDDGKPQEMKHKKNTAVSGKRENPYDDQSHQMVMSNGRSSKQKRQQQKQEMRAIFDEKPRKGNRAIIDDRIPQSNNAIQSDGSGVPPKIPLVNKESL